MRMEELIKNLRATPRNSTTEPDNTATACRVAGICHRRAVCWRSSVTRYAGSTGSAVGVSNSPAIDRTRAQVLML
jgi:hypothetical protein